MDALNSLFTVCVPCEDIGDTEKFEAAVRDVVEHQFEGDFEVGDVEFFWLQLECVAVPEGITLDAVENQVSYAFKRALANRFSAWQVNDTRSETRTDKTVIHFWMGPADLLTVIH